MENVRQSKQFSQACFNILKKNALGEYGFQLSQRFFT